METLNLKISDSSKKFKDVMIVMDPSIFELERVGLTNFSLETSDFRLLVSLRCNQLPTCQFIYCTQLQLVVRGLYTILWLHNQSTNLYLIFYELWQIQNRIFLVNVLRLLTNFLVLYPYA